MKTGIKWILSAILTLISLAIIGGLTWLIANSVEDYEIPETVREVITLVGFILLIGLIIFVVISMFKQMIDNMEKKK